MPITIERTDFDGFEALQDIGQDNHSDVVQLGRGHMTGSINHMTFNPTFGISSGRFSLAMRAAGVLSHTRWCLGFLLRSSGPAFGHHHKFKAGDLAIAAPGEERYIKFQNNTEYVAPFITEEELERFLNTSPGALELLHQHRLSILHAPPATAQANIEEMRKVLRALAEQGTTMPDRTVEFYRRGILTMVAAPIRDAAHYRGARLVRQDSLVHDIEYHYANTSAPVHISEICEDFGVHPRALHRAFHDVVGMGPVAYLRRKRLNDVHTALRRDGPGVTVKKVAIDHGFTDPSRFASAYQHLFGELPSQTLKRNTKGLLAAWVALHFIFQHTVRLTAIYDDSARHAVCCCLI
jgi:AraC family ethanolamine operon transcriptional activator